jgi:hypothetical protein
MSRRLRKSVARTAVSLLRLLLCGLLGTTGCHLIFPFDHSEPAQDSRRLDSVSDLLDSSVDLPGVDLPGVDLPAMDLSLDKPSPADPCLSDVEHDPFMSSSIKLCQNLTTSGEKNQCDAGDLCNEPAGWHLCTLVEYQARSGGQPTNSINAWLAACIRSGAGPHQPSGYSCTLCNSNMMGTALYVSWVADGTNKTHTPHLYVGVHASDKERRVGVNLPQYQGYWDTLGASYLTLTASMCCK